MTELHGAVVTELPNERRWVFGGRPYGLEPLTLPVDPVAPAGALSDVPAMPLTAVLANRPLSTADELAGELPRPEPVEQMFWFRWITGHQVTFVLWQLLARANAVVPADHARRTEVAHQVVRLIRAYSAMLLYTGSCPRQLYHDVIRPSMIRQHPAFSGTWARDHRPVRGLLRGRLSEAWGSANTSIVDECVLNARVHQGVADKLVPGAPSLLQASIGHGPLVWRREVLAVLYDTYFLTLRASLPLPAVLIQLVRRVDAINRDLAANGLYPRYASSLAEKPAHLLHADVEACERSLPQLLSKIVDETITGSIP